MITVNAGETAGCHVSIPTPSAEWVGVVPVTAGTVSLIAGFLAAQESNAVSRSFHICFFADAQVTGAASVEIARTNANARCSVVEYSDGLSHVAMIDAVTRHHPGRDPVLLSIDATLPFAWDARLQKAAYAEPHIAAASAMCDVAPMFALVEDPAADGAAIDATLIDRTAYTFGNRSYYEVPKVHSVCTYFRRDALNALSAAGERAVVTYSSLDILTTSLRANGWSCVLCDFLYVGTTQRVPTLFATDDIEELAFRQHHPLGGLRRTVAAALHEGIVSVSVPGLDARPVQLHIMHFWGGGLDKWVRDFGRVDSSRINLIFSSFRIGETGGQRLVLYSDPVDLKPVRVWDLAQPIRSTLPHNIEYRRILVQIIREFEVEAIIVSSLIGHTLDAISQPLKTLVVCHDFYPVCQAINPQFGTTCERCTFDDLQTCAKSNPLNRIFVDQTSNDWHAMRRLYVERLLEGNIELVVPSPSVETTLKRIAPRMKGLKFHLIPHGIDMDVAPLSIATRAATEPLRLVVLGRLSTQKGAELLRGACEALRSFAQITIVGGGGNGTKLANECGWTCIEKFVPEELPAILQRLAPHAGVLASIIPETFSYTLSELNRLGIPALATNLGSFNDRIKDGENGFLFPPTAEGLVALARKLFETPLLLTQVADALRTNVAHRGVAEMVVEYHERVPLPPRSVARFRVGVGMQTGLTDPYRHLSEAYAQLTGAYEHTKVAYEQSLAEREQLQAVVTASKQWAYDFDAINVRNRWWRYRAALTLTEAFREKLQSLRYGEAPAKRIEDENSAL